MPDIFTPFESNIRRAYNGYVSRITSPNFLNLIINKARGGDIDGAVGLIDAHVKSFSNILTNVYINAGHKLFAGKDIPLGLSFDPYSESAKRFIENLKSNIDLNFRIQQQNLIRNIISTSLAFGDGDTIIKKKLSDAIGLTDNQYQLVQTYKLNLENLNRKALKAGMRSKGSDKTVLNAIKNNRALKQSQIDRLTTIFKRNQALHRSKIIARTQAIKVVNAARLEAAFQIVENTDLEVSEVKKIWNNSQDDKVRDQHDPMHGNTVSLNEFFIDGDGNRLMYPGDDRAPLDTIINCRCFLTFKFQ